MLRLINKKNILLIFILLLGFSLRIYKLTKVPPSLNWDEVSIGYNAYSIFKTGRDEWRKFLPIHFKSYGEYKLPGQIYASVPAIAIFGLNPLGVRITPVIYGTFTVLLLYLLTIELFRSVPYKHKIGLLSSFLLAISPWHIQLTRASFESSFSVFWVILGLWLFIKGFKNPKWWVYSIFPFVVSIYTYNSARIFTPLFLIALFLIYKKQILKFKRQALISIFIFIAFLIPLIPFITSGEVSARYKLVSITDDPGLIPRINERRGMSKLPAPLPRLIHNKVTYISFYFAKNYLAHFTPAFLFLTGAGHKQHHIQGMGELYWFQAPFILLGLYYIFKKKEKFRWIIIAWLLLAFIPVSTTNDSIPNALRTLIAVSPYQLLTAYGMCYTFLYLRDKRTLRLGLGIAVVFLGFVQFVNYLNNYYRVYPVLYSRDWQYGNKQAVEFIKDNYDKYDLIVYTREYGEPHMFTLFYLNYSPQKFQYDTNLVRFETHDWVRVLKFDKFYFPDLGDEGTKVADVIKESPGKKILFIGTPDEIPEGIKKLETIHFLDGNIAFEIFED